MPSPPPPLAPSQLEGFGKFVMAVEQCIGEEIKRTHALCKAHFGFGSVVKPGEMYTTEQMKQAQECYQIFTHESVYRCPRMVGKDVPAAFIEHWRFRNYLRVNLAEEGHKKHLEYRRKIDTTQWLYEFG